MVALNFCLRREPSKSINVNQYQKRPSMSLTHNSISQGSYTVISKIYLCIDVDTREKELLVLSMRAFLEKTMLI